MKAQYIKDLTPDDAVDSAFALCRAERCKKQNGDAFLRGQLQDRTGSMAAVAWTLSEDQIEAALASRYVHIRGVVTRYKGGKQIKISSAPEDLGEPEDRADFTLAKIVLERAIKIGEATYRPDHPEVAVWVNNLGLVLQDMGDMAGAKDNYKRALEIDEAIYGPNHPNVAAMVNNLAGVLSKMGNLEGAKSLYERALRIDEATYGPNHSEVATDVNNLGSVLKDMGDLAGAKANYERALRIRRQFLGDDHLDTKSVQGWLADVMAALAAQQKQGQGQQLGETHAVDKAVGKPGKGWWPWLKR